MASTTSRAGINRCLTKSVSTISVSSTNSLLSSSSSTTTVNSCLRGIHYIDTNKFERMIKRRKDKLLIIDSRSFLEYNTCHVKNAINVSCSKIVKRRLQHDKVSIKELLVNSCGVDLHETMDVIVYDSGSFDYNLLPEDTFTTVLLNKLKQVVNSVSVVVGGFIEIKINLSNQCENYEQVQSRNRNNNLPLLTSMSQPCLSISHNGPTRILPFLYLGSQYDAQNKELLRSYNITYELNVSVNCPKSDFINESHYMRIPVNDDYTEKLLPFFPDAFRFLDKVRESGGSAIVHCLAGISRSATVAIAYVMRHLKMSSDDAYRYVKAKRVSISPNFNFLGQLLEYESELKRDRILEHQQKDCTPQECTLQNYSSPVIIQECQ